MASPNTKRVPTSEKDRMHFRLDTKIKQRVARAVAITGQGLTDFAVAALSEKADEILERHDAILLTRDDYRYFLKALDSKPRSSKRARSAAKRYRRGRRDGVRYHVDN